MFSGCNISHDTMMKLMNFLEKLIEVHHHCLPDWVSLNLSCLMIENSNFTFWLDFQIFQRSQFSAFPEIQNFIETFYCRIFSHFTTFLCVFLLIFKFWKIIFSGLCFNHRRREQCTFQANIEYTELRWCNLSVYISGTCAKVINLKILSILPSKYNKQ